MLQRWCSRFCMTLHRAQLLVECFFLYGVAPLPPLSIDVLKIMKGAVHSEYVFCVPSSAYALQLLFALVKITHCVDHGVLASLDAKTQFILLVWKNCSTFLKHPYLLFLTLEYPFPVVNLTCFSRKVVLWYGQLPPVTSLLLDLNGFVNSVVLGLVCRLSLPRSHFQNERI